MYVALCLLCGLLAGVLGGFFGVGGGIVIVPFLTLAMGFTQHKAQGTSLVALLAPVGLLGLINYYKAGNADLKTGALIALAFFGGAWIGSKFAVGLNEDVMRKAFAVFLVLVGAYTFFRK